MTGDCQRVSGQASVARRSTTGTAASADSDFDKLVEEKWQRHLASMDASIARSKGKRGRYYQAWLATMALEKEHQSGQTKVESDVGSPPFTEDDRRPRPALHEDHCTGGRGESKLEGEEVSLFLPEVVDRACHQFAKFWNVSRAIVDEAMIVRHSPSLGIAGWSDPETVV